MKKKDLTFTLELPDKNEFSEINEHHTKSIKIIYGFLIKKAFEMMDKKNNFN